MPLGNIKGAFLRKTSVLVAICGWLMASAAISSEETQKMSARVNADKSGVFNVLSYGAVGDDKTDNTEAISACLKALVEAGGGRMFLPDGVYRGIIIIPGTKKWITIEIAGESEPTPAFGTILTFPMHNKGTILKCLSESGPAAISAANTPEKLYSVFSGAYVVVRNLEVRTYDNPGIGGIDLKYAVQCRLENIVVNTGVYNVQAAKPTRGTCGLITPANGNGHPHNPPQYPCDRVSHRHSGARAHGWRQYRSGFQSQRLGVPSGPSCLPLLPNLFCP